MKERTFEKAHAVVAATALCFLAYKELYDLTPTRGTWVAYALPLVVVMMMVGYILYAVTRR